MMRLMFGRLADLLLRSLKTTLLALLGYKVAVALINLGLFPKLTEAQKPLEARTKRGLSSRALHLPHSPLPIQNSSAESPRVSILMPMRNEARNLPHTLPGLLEQLNFKGVELLVLDDSSSDDSFSIAQKMAVQQGHFHVLHGKTLPEGWVGKNWACHQLAQHARGEILIFTDADVLWQKGALAALLEQMERQNADLLSVWPRQQVQGWGERLIVPLIDDVLLTLFPYPLIYLPFRVASAGNGQLMAFRRSAYEKLGGHASVRNEVLEDVKLARKLKGIGGRLRLALGGTVIGVRMYHGYVEALEGFGKNLRSFHGGSMVLVLASMVFHVLAYTLPWLLWKRGFASVALLGLLERYLVNLKTGRTEKTDLLEPLSTPLSPLAALPIYARALKKKYRWKGREYQR